MTGMVWRCGHARTAENTAMGRRCRICRNAYDQARKNKLVSKSREPRVAQGFGGPMVRGEDPHVIRARMSACNDHFVRALWREINMIKRGAA